MKGLTVALMAIALVSLGNASAAPAFEGGGRKPSEAPLISFGQRYSGQLNNHKADANDPGDYAEVAIWRLPPLTTHDLVTVNWHELPVTHGSGFPICLILAQNVDDYSWGSVFHNTQSYCDEDGPVYSVSGSGTAQTAITVQETNTSSSYLEFFSDAYATEPADLETYPYDFSVEAPRHFLGVAFKPMSEVSANGTLGATATRADGSAAADGLSFTLTATWRDGGISTVTASTGGGALSFPLSLPETAVGKKVTFQISRAADAEYQDATSTKLVLPVTAPTVAVSVQRCRTARRRVKVLTRQIKRLRRNSRRVRSFRARRRLRHRAHKKAIRLRQARARVRVACGH